MRQIRNSTQSRKRDSSPPLVEIAARVVEQSNRDHPADAVLRQTLKAAPDLFPADARDIAGMVFAFFRWRNWLDQSKGTVHALQHAASLDAQFQRDPDRMSAADLRARAVPEWIHDEMDIQDAWLRSLQREPVLWLRARAGTADSLRAKLSGAQPGRLPDSLSYGGDQDLFRTPEFHAGEFELQDISSQAVGWVCNPRPGETWWDACAGEGGKTLHLSGLMQNKGLVIASDRAAWRLQRLKRRAARAGVFNYRMAPWDGGIRLPTKTKFDGILVDAPCSGVGTWQRNPHARWTTTPDDVRELAAVQKSLLQRVAGSLKPGGRLVYAVCTLARKETDEVADHFEKAFPEFAPLPLVHPLKPNLPAAPRIWIWPQDSGGNGMFIAAWNR